MRTIYFYDQNKLRQQKLEKALARKDAATLAALITVIASIYIMLGVAF